MNKYIPIEYKNFKPSIRFSRLASRMMSDLYSSSTEFSSINVVFEKHGKDYAGYSAIDTFYRTFVAYAVDSNVYSVLQKLEQQLSMQIKEKNRENYEHPYRRIS